MLDSSSFWIPEPYLFASITMSSWICLKGRFLGPWPQQSWDLRYQKVAQQPVYLETPMESLANG